MIELDRRILFFKRKDVWFSQEPFDVKNCDYVVFHFCSQASLVPGFDMIEGKTLGIELSQDLKLIWEQLAKTTRYEISKAQEMGIKVKINEDHQEFMAMNQRFRESKRLHPFQVPIDEMKQNGVLFVSFYDDEMQGGQFYLEDDKNIRLVLSVSRRMEVQKSQHKYMGYANKLLVWEAICYAKAQGKDFFDLGGYSEEPQLQGVNQFKEGFSKNIYKSYRYSKTYSKAFTWARSTYHSLRRIRI